MYCTCNLRKNQQACPNCSKLKVVVYLQDNTKIVWYNFMKQQAKPTSTLYKQMLKRIENKYGTIKIAIPYNNQTKQRIVI